MELETPRDRNGQFRAEVITNRTGRFTGFDDKIISMYSRGMTTREIEGHLQGKYRVEVSRALISSVTDAVLEEVKALAKPAARRDVLRFCTWMRYG